MGTFAFNGFLSSDYGVTVEERQTGSAPKKIMNTYTIPGRNGTLSQSTGAYENIDVKYKVWLCDSLSKTAALKAVLYEPDGYVKLEDDYDLDTYRWARYTGGVDFEAVLQKHLRTALTFDCRPERFLRSGDETITYTESGRIYNTESFTSIPEVRIYGTGTVTINGYPCEIISTDTYVDLDGEAMQAHKDGISCDSDVYIPDYPKLTPGANSIVLAGDISKIEIKPRWWRL